jgi:hypothetical protein
MELVVSSDDCGVGFTPSGFCGIGGAVQRFWRDEAPFVFVAETIASQEHSDEKH